MKGCDCKHGNCTGYLPNNAKLIRCTKTTNITNALCPDCQHYEKRPNTPTNINLANCCGGENKTFPGGTPPAADKQVNGFEPAGGDGDKEK